MINKGILSYLLDYQDEYNFQLIKVWLQNLQTISGDYSILNLHLQEGNTNQALMSLNEIPQNNSLTPDQLIEHNFISQLKLIQMNWVDNGKTFLEINPNELSIISTIANESSGLAGVYAKNLLEYFGYDFYNPAILPEVQLQLMQNPEEGEKSMVETDGTHSIYVYPNPVQDWAVFHYQLPLNVQKPLLTVSSINGEIIKVFELSNEQGEVVFDTSNLEKGIYFFTLEYSNKVQESKQILILR